MDDAALVKRYTELELERRRFKAGLEAVTTEQAELQVPLLEAWERNGWKHISGNGLTLALRRDIRVSAKGGDSEALCAALEAEGFPQFIKRGVNSNTLSAFVREYDRSGEALPERIADAVTIFEQFSITARKSD